MRMHARSFNLRLAGTAILALLLLSAAAVADDCPNVKTVPGGLKPGDTYYLAFVSQGQRNALDNDIAKYNQFVQNEAEKCATLKAAGIKWKAVASTPKVSANDNLDLKTAPPIYLLDGNTRVVERAGNLFSGNELENPIWKDQFANEIRVDLSTWTGTTAKGEISQFPLGNPKALGTRGQLSSTSSLWVSGGGGGIQFDLRLYAISERLTVPKQKQDDSELTIQMVAGGSPALALVGHSNSLTVSVQAQGEPVPGAVVEFKSVLGDLQFVGNELGFDDSPSVVTTDVNGQARAQFIARQPGLSIIQAKAGNSTLQVSVSATNVPLQ